MYFFLISYQRGQLREERDTVRNFLPSRTLRRFREDAYASRFRFPGFFEGKGIAIESVSPDAAACASKSHKERAAAASLSER